MSRNNTNRVTPEVTQNYNLNPSAAVVDKQSKYTPQLEEAAKLKQTADSLAKLAKGIADTDALLRRQANENAIVANAKTIEENRDKWAEVSNNIQGMAKFNPYNKEAYMSLRAKANMEQGVYQLAELEATAKDLEYEEFETKRNQILTQTMQNMSNEGLKARHTAGYLTKLQNQSFKLKDSYITQKAERDYQILQNQMVSSASKDIATLTYDNPDGYITGWNEAIKRLETTANGVGMNNTKQYELVQKTINQYLVDNVDEIDAEEFMIAVGQTTINGKPLSEFDPNYATTMKQLLVKAKQAKYEVDSMDLKLEKLRLEKASLNAYAEMYSTMADPNKTLAEKKQKAMELINKYGMEAVGFDFLHKIANDEKTLLTLETAQTDPRVFEKLIQSYIAGELSQDEVLAASKAGQLGANDAYSLFKSLRTDDRRDTTTMRSYLNKRYFDDKDAVELGTNENGERYKDLLMKDVFDIETDENLSVAEKHRRLSKVKETAQYLESKYERIHSSDPMKLLSREYMREQRIPTQSVEEAQRGLAKLGLFTNQIGWKDTNIKVSSPMQAKRIVPIVDDSGNKRTVNRPHYGTDVETYLGRTIVAPKTGKVIASGYEKSMGNYILFERTDGRGYIKFMHLQYANLPKAGTAFVQGYPMAHVGNTGDVTTKNGVGILHVECFDKRMKLVTPEEFLKG